MEPLADNLLGERELIIAVTALDAVVHLRPSAIKVYREQFSCHGNKLGGVCVTRTLAGNEVITLGTANSLHVWVHFRVFIYQGFDWNTDVFGSCNFGGFVKLEGFGQKDLPVLKGQKLEELALLKPPSV